MGTPVATPAPTADVAEDLLELVEWAEDMEEEILQPVEEMATTLDVLFPDTGVPDVGTFCTGVEVALATLVEVQRGLDTVGPPPIEDPDLQECWNELNAAVDDFYEALLLLDSYCETRNLADLRQAAEPLYSGAEHLENAAAALERWESRMGI